MTMSIKQTARRIIHRLAYSEPGRRLATWYLNRWWRAETHRVWSHRDGPPEWYDHRSHLATFSHDRDPLWAERGVYSREPMFDGCRVLDLCCGDGFYAFHFFADRASHIDAVDFGPAAIAHARAHHALPNITHGLIDVRVDALPADRYDVIVWDGAIEHFTLDEIDAVLGRCAAALSPSGVLTGYTMRREETAQHPEHEHEFEDAAELRAALGKRFPAVAVLENSTAGRRNMYFRAGFDAAALSGFH